MATYTSRYGLSKPETTDEMQSFMSDYADNMDKIDENLGGGGGSANIVELTQAEYDALPDSKLSDNVVYMIKDALSASDAELTHVNGIFVDPTNVLYNNDNISQNPFSYTATEDCYVKAYCRTDSTAQFEALIDSVQVGINYNTSANFELFVKKGQVFTLLTNGSVPGWGMRVEVYGIQQGSNVTIIPDYASACYSTAEREVGCWVDGKPLYQKTLTYTVTSPINSNTVLGSISDIDKVASIEGIAYYEGHGRGWLLPLSMSSYSSNISYDNGNIILNITNDTYGVDWVFYVTVQYTKTTDTAGSGQFAPTGAPTHHYSTSEQVIGTWVDGKPLYETSFPITSTTTFTSNSWVDMGINQGDMYKIIDGKLIMDYQGAYSFQNLQFGWISNKLVGNSFRNFEVEANHGYVVLQYTKSTD